jgi:hypothetical protein
MSRKKRPRAGSSTGPLTAVAWYTREEWDAVRQEASDPEVFDASYDEWQANATRVLEKLREQGVAVQRVFVRAAALRTWCAQHGISRNAQARSRYAADRLRDVHEQNPHVA